MISDSSDTKFGGAIAVVSHLLKSQLGTVRNLKTLSDSQDQFALGYVFGFHDCICQVSGIQGNSAEGFALLALSYATLAGEEGLSILQRSLDQLKRGEQKFAGGVQLGGRDLLAFIKNKTPPTGLFLHIDEF